ncbi:hypothetical protein ONZ45_g6287 [Pleurotus djamor]|nr:hypothetical protein ONZ45_g6287 [Pleurotus djamor]
MYSIYAHESPVIPPDFLSHTFETEDAIEHTSVSPSPVQSRPSGSASSTLVSGFLRSATPEIQDTHISFDALMMQSDLPPSAFQHLAFPARSCSDLPNSVMDKFFPITDDIAVWTEAFTEIPPFPSKNEKLIPAAGVLAEWTEDDAMTPTFEDEEVLCLDPFSAPEPCVNVSDIQPLTYTWSKPSETKPSKSKSKPKTKTAKVPRKMTVKPVDVYKACKCGYNAVSAGQWSRHWRFQCENGPKEKCICEDCGAELSRPDALNRHRRAKACVPKPRRRKGN